MEKSIRKLKIETTIIFWIEKTYILRANNIHLYFYVEKEKETKMKGIKKAAREYFGDKNITSV